MFHLLLLSLLCCAPGFISSAPAMNAAKVDFTLYYESLCPDCQLFIREQLYPTYEKIGDIFNLTLVPYGNAEERRRGNQWIFNCQHGPKECEGNLIETCAISLVKSFNVTFQFIHCFEGIIGSYQDPFTAAKECARQFGIDYPSIEKCQLGPMGNELEHEMALKTNALKPQHQYVPWVTVNGKHTEKLQREAENNLLELICSYYTGPKPPSCERSRKTPGRCYRDKPQYRYD